MPKILYIKNVANNIVIWKVVMQMSMSLTMVWYSQNNHANGLTLSNYNDNVHDNGLTFSHLD